MPAQSAIRVDGVDAVTARVDDAVGAHGRPGVDVATAGLGADPDPLGARAHLHDPARFGRGSAHRVKVVVVGADVDRSVVTDGRRAENDVPRRVRPPECSVTPDLVQLAVLGPDQHRAVRSPRAGDDTIGPPVANVHQTAGLTAGSTNGERPRWVGPKRNIAWAGSIAYCGSGHGRARSRAPPPTAARCRPATRSGRRRTADSACSPCPTRTGFASTWAQPAPAHPQRPR